MPYRGEQEILVAGCGTSQAAKVALKQPAAQVLGIDVSSTSLRHTKKLKRKYNLANLDIHQLPIERVHELERSFDQIICTGVLHHLADPDAALRALRSVLKPNGAMHLMVYAPYGRTGITMLQEYCRRLGIGTSDKEIRDLVAVLKTLPHGHPLEHLLRETPDFRRSDALADALLNPRDRAYSVPQRSGVWTLGSASALSAPLWRPSKEPASGSSGPTSRTGTVRRSRAVPGDDSSPQRYRVPQRPARR
jgi:SAM-dependent methyltransferase